MRLRKLISIVIFLAGLPKLNDAFGYPMSPTLYNNAQIVARARNLQIQQEAAIADNGGDGGDVATTENGGQEGLNRGDRQASRRLSVKGENQTTSAALTVQESSKTKLNKLVEKA